MKNYFITLKNRIDKLEKFLYNPQNIKDLYNPFSSAIPKTYVWIDNPETDKQEIGS